jgi:hypothetical protein
VELRQQLQFWVAGISFHNAETDTCCPDFSCCLPSNQAPREERERFLLACQQEDEATAEEFLQRWLESALRAYPKRKGRWALQLSPEEPERIPEGAMMLRSDSAQRQPRMGQSE